MNSDEEKRVLVVKTNQMMSQEARLKTRQKLQEELKDGVVLLPAFLEFCCVVSADEVYIMHDDLFPCDPDKNDRCKKSRCYRNGGDCSMTQFEIYRR